jgi:hypothetical protein
VISLACFITLCSDFFILCILIAVTTFFNPVLNRNKLEKLYEKYKKDGADAVEMFDELKREKTDEEKPRKDAKH